MNSAFKWEYLSFSPLLFASLIFTALCKASSGSHFAFLHFFFLGDSLDPCLLYNVMNLHPFHKHFLSKFPFKTKLQFERHFLSIYILSSQAPHSFERSQLGIAQILQVNTKQYKIMSLPSSTENNSSLNEHYGFKFLKK